MELSLNSTSTSSISFPSGLAKGAYFCNRVSETKRLLRNIQNCTHTVLISPRRYGKTSLAYHAINKSCLPSARIDLYMSTSGRDVEAAILHGIDNILTHVSSSAESLLATIKKYIQSLRPSFEGGATGFKIKLEPVDRQTHASNICEALKILDAVLAKKNKKAVLLIDEFQEVERVAGGLGIEGAIRHVAQETENFTIIFSGNKRHLLQDMFNDRNKPLYRLCDELHLARISEQDYKPFLEKFSVQRWRQVLPEMVVERLLLLSDCHPYYFNALADRLFAQAKLPKAQQVDQLWQELIEIKRRDLLAETQNLTILHKKLLVAIAHGITEELTGKKFLIMAELSGSSVIRGLEYLEQQDFIEKEDGHYHMIDPLLAAEIKQLSQL